MFLRLTDFHLGCGEKLYHGTEVDIFSLTPRTTFTSRVDEDRYSLRSRKKYVVQLRSTEFYQQCGKNINVCLENSRFEKHSMKFFICSCHSVELCEAGLTTKPSGEVKENGRSIQHNTQTQFATGSFQYMRRCLPVLLSDPWSMYGCKYFPT